MRVRFFGEPWGVGGRAPICENDRFKIETPVGTKCLECTRPIEERDRGVVTACSPSIWGSWPLQITPTEEDLWDEEPDPDPKPVTVTACSYHLACWLTEVIGGEMSEKLMSRMRQRPPMTGPVKPAVDDDVEPGRGWGSE